MHTDAMTEKFNFDTVPDRSDMSSAKWNRRTEAEKREGIVPFSIADMEFETAPCVKRAIRRVADSGSFGYADVDGAYFSAVAGWMQRRHGWAVEKEWIVVQNGVVPAISVAIRAFTAPGDSILMLSPRYAPFESVAIETGRVPVCSELRLADGRYTVDFDDFQTKAAGAKLFLLCSPHNPTGRVWTADELRRMVRICGEHGLLIVSDEIHHDLTLKQKHRVFCDACPETRNLCLVLTTPAKTFSVAGLQLANTIIPDQELREKYLQRRNADGYGSPSLFGVHATIAAYNEGDAWLEALLDYVRGNFEFLETWLRKNIPGIKMVPAEATYLAWLDCRALALDDEALLRLFREKAGIIPNPGPWFGAGGSGFMRLNIAMPRAEMEKALHRLREAMS